MSSYFDAVRREVSELSRGCPDTPEGQEAFLVGLTLIEDKMKRDCALFAGDIETPEDVRQAIIGCIALNEVRYDGGDFLGGRYGDDPNSKPIGCRATEHAAVFRSSQLEREMHSLWHDIARMRYQMRYGLVLDNPAYAVQHRNQYAEMKAAAATHDRQVEARRESQRPFSEKKPLVCQEYRLPKKREPLGQQVLQSVP